LRRLFYRPAPFRGQRAPRGRSRRAAARSPPADVHHRAAGPGPAWRSPGWRPAAPPGVLGRTQPAHRPLGELDHILASRRGVRCGGEVLPLTSAPTIYRCAPGCGSD